MRNEEFFDVENFPTIEVTVDSAEVTAPGSGSMQVQLNIKGVQRDINLPVEATTLDDGAVQIVTKGTVNRANFGVDGNMFGMMGDTTAIEATAVFLRQS